MAKRIQVRFGRLDCIHCMSCGGKLEVLDFVVVETKDGPEGFRFVVCEPCADELEIGRVRW